KNMPEPEPDPPTQWSFFNIDSIFSNNYYGDSSQHDVKICHEQYFKDDPCSIERSSILDDDEILAHALLEEELSRLAITDSARRENDECCLQSSPPPVTDWNHPSNGGEGDSARRTTGGDGGGSFCSSPGNRSVEEDGHSHGLDITDESEIDGEVEKRLYQMNPVPHIPRINGDIPSVDEATSDHQRLLDRLKLYDLIEHKVEGDGNCQFRALSDQFYRTPEHHKFVRQQVVLQLQADPEIYEGYVPMEYAEYLKKMSKNSEWGDHVTLQAAADSYGVRIIVVTSYKDTCYIEILPKLQKSKRVIYLSFWAEVHYNSIYPQG
ncbi:hypothetical protein M569_15476, partial [Genlisea aurea]